MGKVKSNKQKVRQIQKKKFTIRQEFHKFQEDIQTFLMRRFTQIDTFHQTTDVVIGAMLDFFYEKGIFTKKEFDDVCSKKFRDSTFNKILNDLGKTQDSDLPQIVDRIVNVMSELDIDRGHDLLKVDSMTKFFGENTGVVLQLLDEKLEDLVKEEESND